MTNPLPTSTKFDAGILFSISIAHVEFGGGAEGGGGGDYSTLKIDMEDLC